MNSKSEGYVLDIPYDDNFYKDLTPNHIEGILQLYGLSLPQRQEGEPFRYLELGYGQGMSLNLHAASHDGEFWGTDLNPTHCLSARKLSAQTGVKAHFLNDSFEELYQKSKNGSLPQFDMICLHGVWSWISEENRNYILQIVSANLKVGGVAYVSYNCMPGWADFMPLRDLLTYHAKAQNTKKGSISKVQEAYKFVSQLEKNGAAYFTRNPSAAMKLKNIGDKSISYVVHEYFNEDWYIPYSKDVATDFEKAKCTFISSSRILPQLRISISPELHGILQEIHDVKLRETVRDFALNTQFRADIYVKGAHAQHPDEVEKTQFALCIHKEHVAYTINVPSGQLNLKKELYEPLVHFLAQDNYKPKTIASIKKALPHMEAEALREAICLFIGCNYIQLAKTPKEEQRLSSKKFNGQMCVRAIKGASSLALASPVLGGGLLVSPIEMLILTGMHQGHDTPQSLVEFVYEITKKQGRELKKENTVLSEAESKAEFLEIIQLFTAKRLPLLQGLGIEILLP